MRGVGPAPSVGTPDAGTSGTVIAAAAYAERAERLFRTQSKGGVRCPSASPRASGGILCVVLCVTRISPIAEVPCFLGKTQNVRGIRFPPAPFFWVCARERTGAQRFARGDVARGSPRTRSCGLQRRAPQCGRVLRHSLRHFSAGRVGQTARRSYGIRGIERPLLGLFRELVSTPTWQFCSTGTPSPMHSGTRVHQAHPRGRPR